MQIGTKTAGCHLPSGKHVFTLHEPPLHAVEHQAGDAHDALLPFFLAASDGTAESATTAATAAPTRHIFMMDFMADTP
jgi:hypothetical protein